MADKTITMVECSHCDGTGQLPDYGTGSILRKEREKAGVTISQVASALDCSAAYVGDLERGNRNWSNELVEKYRKAVEELKA